ncbi:acyl-CoA dehydrogenase [Aeromicrobium sp. A1-2]|uniref:acyl-CoA dehydrogenase family protein n=1 Tax=Aeromicrobium sp. A1-2 TaxID=2107713 RepID=UPI000E4C36FF|nr:acyl-CoA dehydrogenase family protein [Aeromicrobium sp. A1-2]AXT84317.1 acyl-CoA dehydrogenase [Aeromicrobium sp. A1-2]
MKFELTSDQRDFMSALHGQIAASDPVAVNRAWAEGDAKPGLDLWQQITEVGVSGLLIPEQQGGVGATPVELVCAFEILGRHAVPGPWIESAAYLAAALEGPERAAIADGTVATVAAPPHTPHAVDADAANDVYVVVDGTVHQAEHSDAIESVDPSRRLFKVTKAGPVGTRDVDAAFDLAVLAASAELLGAGERVLADAVTYVKQRTQFGRTIGSYQAIKHQLANVRIALDFARPLIVGAALDPSPRAVSAAKIQAAAAANLSARVGLQVHGAIGYTAEFDLSLWLLRIRALQSAWGTPAFHRERVLASLLSSRSSSPTQ